MEKPARSFFESSDSARGRVRLPEFRPQSEGTQRFERAFFCLFFLPPLRFTSSTPSSSSSALLLLLSRISSKGSLGNDFRSSCSCIVRFTAAWLCLSGVSLKLSNIVCLDILHRLFLDIPHGSTIRREAGFDLGQVVLRRLPLRHLCSQDTSQPLPL